MFNKIGVEMEFETHNECVGDFRDDLWDTLRENLGMPINEVKGDGSLSSGGVEVTTTPIRIKHNKDLIQVVEYMNDIRDIITAEFDGYTEPPSAIHIHTSGHKKPTNLMYLLGGLFELFRYIKHTNNWGFMLYPNELISLNDARNFLYQNTNSKQLINDGSNYSQLIRYCLSKYAQHRPTVLRPSPYDTLELRPLPNRQLGKIYFLYIDLITKFTILGDKISLKDGEVLGDLFFNIHNRDRVKVLKKVTGWKNKDVRDFMYKKNRHSIPAKEFDGMMDNRMGTPRLSKGLLGELCLNKLDEVIPKKGIKVDF